MSFTRRQVIPHLPFVQIAWHLPGGQAGYLSAIINIPLFQVCHAWSFCLLIPTLPCSTAPVSIDIEEEVMFPITLALLYILTDCDALMFPSTEPDTSISLPQRSPFTLLSDFIWSLSITSMFPSTLALLISAELHLISPQTTLIPQLYFCCQYRPQLLLPQQVLNRW